MNHPDWFSTSVRQGLQMLVTLSLRGTPMPETIGLTAEVWEGVVSGTQMLWDEQADAPRIREAFSRLARSVDRWPAPKQLLDAMPDRPPVRSLSPPPLTPEQIARNKTRIRELREMIAAMAERKRVRT